MDIEKSETGRISFKNLSKKIGEECVVPWRTVMLVIETLANNLTELEYGELARTPLGTFYRKKAVQVTINKGKRSQNESFVVLKRDARLARKVGSKPTRPR